MNKYQEAFNNFKTLKYIPNAAGLTMNLALLGKDIYTFHELVDKATPMKIVQKQVKHWIDYHCPSCNHKLRRDTQYKYCPHCGQALDWSE